MYVSPAVRQVLLSALILLLPPQSVQAPSVSEVDPVEADGPGLRIVMVSAVTARWQVAPWIS